MPTRIDRNQVFDGQGNLISEELVEVEVPEPSIDEEVRTLHDKVDALTELLAGGS